MKEYAFGIDLGGTTAKAGLFTTAGALLEKWEIPTDTSDKGVRILPNLAAAILDKMKEQGLTTEQIEGVGIGVPGPVQESSVVPIVCANLGGWGQQDVAANLSLLLGGIKVMVGNDATEDTAALEQGIGVYLVTDCLLNPKGRDISDVPQGTFAAFLEFAGV